MQHETECDYASRCNFFCFPWSMGLFSEHRSCSVVVALPECGLDVCPFYSTNPSLMGKVFRVVVVSC